MRKLFLILATLAAFATTATAQTRGEKSPPASILELQQPLAHSDSSEQEALLWRCDAWPAWSNGYGYDYYWIHWNVNVAYYNAMNYCTYYHGNVCLYRCVYGIY